MAKRFALHLGETQSNEELNKMADLMLSIDEPHIAVSIAKAAAEQGVPFTLVTGLPLPEQHIDNVLASPETVLAHEKFERIEAVFAGAGDTLTAALAALLATGMDLPEATSEALAKWMV
mgnify:CR=1 FL=1